MVGDTVGVTVGSDAVGDAVGETVGADTVGECVGEVVGDSVGCDVDGDNVGETVGDVVGLTVGEQLGACAIAWQQVSSQLDSTASRLQSFTRASQSIWSKMSLRP